jgi:hypothetical protein
MPAPESNSKTCEVLLARKHMRVNRGAVNERREPLMIPFIAGCGAISRRKKSDE